MNLGELVSHAARDIRDDIGADDERLVSPAEWRRFANEAQVEACRRGRLLVDSSTPEICHYSIMADNPVIVLDSRVLFIRRARLVTAATRLLGIRTELLDRAGTMWEDDIGDVSHVVINWQSGALRLYPIPQDDDELRLTVVRMPLAPMVDEEDTPEINSRFHEGLIHWMKYRAYNQQDTDLEKTPRAMKFLGLFEEEFGNKSSAKDEIWLGEKHTLDAESGVY